MRVARVLYPVHSLGPGERIVIWVQGCDRRCDGCANPELWDKNKVIDIPLSFLIGMVRSAIKNYKLTGITITGGEPFLQSKELSTLLKSINDICSDILVFSGYTYQQLVYSQDKDIHDFLNGISVLIDGPYLKEKNLSEKLRGSRNQNMLFLDPKIKDQYNEYIHNKHEKRFEQFFAEDGIISVGIHPPDYEAWLENN